MAKLLPGVRYDMPVGFGPSIYSETTRVPHATLISTAFDTEPAAVAEILPDHLELGEVPTVYVNRIQYDAVDYLHGRGYEEFIVAINARYRRGGEDISAPYVSAIWVNQVAALTSGREWMGQAKLYADIPLVEDHGDRLRFEALEYDTCFLRGEVRNLRELPAEQVAKIAAAQNPYSFGWKYMAGLEGKPDIDYATLLKMDWNYEQAWVGEGESEFLVASRAELPVSLSIVETIAKLPVVKRRPAFVGKGPAVIYRSQARRLP